MVQQRISLLIASQVTMIIRLRRDVGESIASTQPTPATNTTCEWTTLCFLPRPARPFTSPILLAHYLISNILALAPSDRMAVSGWQRKMQWHCSRGRLWEPQCGSIRSGMVKNGKRIFRPGKRRIVVFHAPVSGKETSSTMNRPLPIITE